MPRRRAYEHGQVSSHCSFSFSVSLLPDRRQFHDDDDDIARRAAATSIRMNTEESITVLIGGADRRENAARSRFASAVRGIEIIIIARTILIARRMR